MPRHRMLSLLCRCPDRHAQSFRVSCTVLDHTGRSVLLWRVCVYVPVSCYCTASKRRLGLRSVKPTQPPQLHRCLVPPLHGNRLFISFLACPPIAHPASVTATGPHQARPVEMGCVKSRYFIRIEVRARNRAYRSIFLYFFAPSE